LKLSFQTLLSGKKQIYHLNGHAARAFTFLLRFIFERYQWIDSLISASLSFVTTSSQKAHEYPKSNIHV